MNFQSFGSHSATPFPTHTIIIGAGLTGPVTALALQQADIKSVVYEAGGPDTSDAGPYVTIAPNGLDALAAIGIDGLAAAGGFVTRATAVYTASGQHVGTNGMGGDSITIRRSRLQRLLREHATSRGICFEFGKRLASAAIVPGGVIARFRDGSDAIGEMLVGCDGVHSAVRRIIDRSSPVPRESALLNFHGHTPTMTEGTAGQWQLIFGRRAFFGYAVDPAGGTAWFATVPSTGPFAANHCTTPNGEWQRLLIEQFRRDAGPAASLVAAGSLELAADAAFDLPHVPRWHRGPMIVLGDAVHAVAPASGQGVALAIEDGVLLAKHLRQLPTGPAFTAFERARRRRVEHVVEQGARTSRHLVPGPIGRIVPGLTLPLVLRYLITERALARVHDHQVKWQQPVVNA